MGIGVVTRLDDIVVVEAQADVVVAAHVIEPGGAVQFIGQATDALIEQLGILGRDGLPQ